MLKIDQVFIIKFLLLFVGTLFITSIISYLTLKSIVIEHNKNHLKHAIEIMDLELNSVNDLDKYIADIYEKTSLRTTVVDEAGNVLADSEANKVQMDNHAQRFEIIESNTKEYGYIIRYSKTLKMDFLYVAKKITYKDRESYIRVSMSLAQIMDDFYSLWIKLFFIFMGILFIALLISKRMSRKVVYDIEQITNYLDEISDKNYKAIIKTKYFYEFLQISLLLKNLVKKLSKQEKKKSKYMAKLRLINRQKNDILSAISHEFKNPVASIIGYAQTIQDDSDMPKIVRDKFLLKISSNGEKISKMLDRLTLSVKLENEDFAITKSAFDLKVLCDEVASNLETKYKDRKILLNVESITLFSDKTMLELALVNLVENALKYSSSDIFIELKDNMILVKDSGIGIKEEELKNITKKFYRVDKNSWNNSMGLGLAMVSYTLKLLGSSLEIESKFGQGSTFSFSIEPMLKS
ncbi:MAG: ATP-binding protein [Sulfurimonas sp.]|uniref:sensor histidine kinase n=1 Tax=Sulfurimonas sp. TaxID=2022749 RepID=UPI00261CFB0A|nr:ATP-binding protein [Sulfurimonas sp.]MDD3476161.1 ATP-binding protein [Sulfurimonas sp.]